MFGKISLTEYGLAAVFGVLGYATFGLPGLVVGLTVGTAAYLGWRLLRSRSELRAAHLTFKARHSEVRAPDGRVDRASGALACSFVVGSLALLLYSSVIALAHDSLAGWMSTLQPAADWLARFIPAFGRVSADLVKTGHADRVLATQHVLLVGWLYLIAMTFWIVSDMLVINRRVWARIGFTAGSVEPVKSTLAACLFLAGFLLIIFFWLVPPPSSGSVDAIFRLPVIALVFDVELFIVWCLSLMWAAHLFRGLDREEDRQRRQMHQEMLRALRDAFSGKSHKR